MTINGLLKKVETLDLRSEAPKLVQQTSYEIIVLNQQQLYSGLEADGDKARPEYKSKYYAKKKNQQNPKPGFGVPDLFATGAFYKGFAVAIKGDMYEIGSVDSKSDRLEKQYGKQIFGLTKKNKEKYAKGVLYEGIKRYVTGKTGLTFG